MDDITRERLAESLTADNTDIIPYLPYLLQDLWELGSSPSIMLELIQQHTDMGEQSRILDLACGKGAVAVKLCASLGCAVTGLDILSEFIEYARQKARDYGVEQLCSFRMANVAQAIDGLTGFDCVIWGAAGNVLGDQLQLLTRLIPTVRPGGYILIDDAFLADEGAKPLFCGEYPTFEGWMQLFRQTGLQLLGYSLQQGKENDNDYNNRCIAERAEQLKQKYPQLAHMFDGYVQTQLDECQDLDGELNGVTWLLQR